MFGRKAAELVREEHRADADKINTYNVRGSSPALIHI